MENYRNDTVVVFAGYPKEMEEFLSLNPGLKSRIPHMVKFANYSSEDMVEIAQFMAKEKGFEFNEDALFSLKVHLQNARHSTSFANGRTVRNLVESVIQKHIIQSFKELDEPSIEQLSIIDSKVLGMVDESNNSCIRFRKGYYS